MRYTIDIQPRAAGDVRRTVSWLTQHVSTLAAARWRARIIKAVHSLARTPDRYPEAEEAAELGIDLRMLLSGRRPHVYRILFTIDGDTVNVLRIIHAAMDRVGEEDL